MVQLSFSSAARRYPPLVPTERRTAHRGLVRALASSLVAYTTKSPADRVLAENWDGDPIAELFLRVGRSEQAEVRDRLVAKAATAPASNWAGAPMSSAS